MSTLVGSYRPGDVLDLLIAEIGIADVEPVADLVAHCRGDADPPWLGHGLEPRGHVHAVAENIAVFDDDVAEIDADAKEQRPRRRHVAIAPGHALLKINGAAQRFRDALELNEHAVARGLDNAAPALDDGRVDDLKPHGLQASERSGLVDLHKAAVADYVGGKNCREPALDVVDFHWINDPSIRWRGACRSPKPERSSFKGRYGFTACACLKDST